jgi:pyruvate dehydrogenase E2 component (dihydrolipoamide acetyltransferase)
MSINITMPALSPTMEEGKLAKWHVKEGDSVSSGDVIAEIETDKATMEVEAVDEGKIGKIVVPEGTDNVKVNAVIAVLLTEGECCRSKVPDARSSGEGARASEGSDCPGGRTGAREHCSEHRQGAARTRNDRHGGNPASCPQADAGQRQWCDACVRFAAGTTAGERGGH